MAAGPSPTVGPAKVDAGAYTAKLKNGNCYVKFQIWSPTLVGDDTTSAPMEIRRLHLLRGLRYFGHLRFSAVFEDLALGSTSIFLDLFSTPI